MQSHLLFFSPIGVKSLLQVIEISVKMVYLNKKEALGARQRDSTPEQVKVYRMQNNECTPYNEWKQLYYNVNTVRIPYHPSNFILLYTEVLLYDVRSWNHFKKKNATGECWVYSAVVTFTVIVLCTHTNDNVAFCGTLPKQWIHTNSQGVLCCKFPALCFRGFSLSGAAGQEGLSAAA